MVGITESNNIVVAGVKASQQEGQVIGFGATVDKMADGETCALESAK